MRHWESKSIYIYIELVSFSSRIFILYTNITREKLSKLNRIAALAKNHSKLENKFVATKVP